VRPSGERIPAKVPEPPAHGDSRLVRIYHRGELIRVHPIQHHGGRDTDYTNYPARRAPDARIRRAEQVGPAVGQFTTVLLSGTFPWPRHLHPSADPALLLDQLKLPVFDLPPTVAPLVGPEQATFRQQERADKSAWTCRIGLPHGEGQGTVAGG
jgi:hypothetical protein